MSAMSAFQGWMRWCGLVSLALTCAYGLASAQRRRALDPRSTRTFAGLEPLMATRGRQFLRLVKRTYPRLDIRAIMGTRTYEEQDALYAIGRTLPGRPVTNARAGQSNHNFGIAFDVGVFSMGAYQPESEWYAKLGELADDAKLDWGGNWHSRLVDRPHYQWPTDLSLRELRRIKASGGLVTDQDSAELIPAVQQRAMRFQQGNEKSAPAGFFARLSRISELLKGSSGITYEDVKSVLPPSALLSQPSWEEDDQAVGSVARLTGPLQGVFVFLNDSQKAGMGTGADYSTVFSPDSRLTQVQIYIGDSIRSDSKALGADIARLLSKHLKMQIAEASKVERPLDNLPGVYGYRASWRFKGRRVDLWQHWYGHRWVLCFYL